MTEIWGIRLDFSQKQINTILINHKETYLKLKMSF